MNSVMAIWKVTTRLRDMERREGRYGTKMLEVSPDLVLCSSGRYPNREWAEQSARQLVDSRADGFPALIRCATVLYGKGAV